MKKPTSHKWAIFVFIAFIIINAMLAMNGALNISTGPMLAACFAALVGLFYFARSKRTYVIAAVALLLIVVRSIYYGVFLPAQQLISGDPAAQQGWGPVAFQAFFAFLLCLLLRAYTFGAASRKFYGYPSPDTDVA